MENDCVVKRLGVEDGWSKGGYLYFIHPPPLSLAPFIPCPLDTHTILLSLFFLALLVTHTPSPYNKRQFGIEYNEKKYNKRLFGIEYKEKERFTCRIKVKGCISIVNITFVVFFFHCSKYLEFEFKFEINDNNDNNNTITNPIYLTISYL